MVKVSQSSNSVGESAIQQLKLCPCSTRLYNWRWPSPCCVSSEQISSSRVDDTAQPLARSRRDRGGLAFHLLLC